VSVRIYYMDDATLTVPAGYRDHTTHVLEWALEGGDKIALVIQRDRLPKAGQEARSPGGHSHAHAAGEDEAHAGAFARYVAGQTRGYPAQFAGFHLERDEVLDGASFEMRCKVFRWRHEQDVLYHNQVFLLLGPDVLVLTGSSKALHRDAVDRLVDEALAGLRARGEDDRT
jgi:hypothetical protein